MRLALITVLSIAGGGILAATGLPLGWLLGAALVTGAVAITGYAVALPVGLQRAGIVMLGVGSGLAVTPGVGGLLLSWLPVMLLTLALSVGLAVALAGLLARRAGTDRATAFFSLLPGGIIEMASIGERHQANRAVITALHTTRTGLIVLGLPVLATLLDHTTTDAAASLVSAAPTLTPLATLLVLAIGAVGGMLAALLRLPACWLVGPIVLVSVLSLGGWMVVGQLPEVVIIIAQLLVGMTLGARFKRRMLLQVPRALLVGLPLQVLMGGVVAGCALALALMTQASPVTLLLASAGGGVAEMVLAAKVLDEQVELIVGFHIVRLVLVNLGAGWLWTVLQQRVRRR